MVGATARFGKWTRCSIPQNANRPVSFDELVDQMPSAYQNDANRWYVAKLTAEGKDAAPTLWSPTQLRSVKHDWVTDRVHGLVRDKRFIANLKDGAGATLDDAGR